MINYPKEHAYCLYSRLSSIWKVVWITIPQSKKQQKKGFWTVFHRPPPVIHFCYVSTQCFHACWHVSHDHIIHIFHAHSAWLKTSRTCVYKRSVVAALDSGVSLGFQGSLKGESYLKVVAERVPSPSLDPCAKLPNSAHVPLTGLAEATCRSS